MMQYQFKTIAYRLIAAASVIFLTDSLLSQTPHLLLSAAASILWLAALALLIWENGRKSRLNTVIYSVLIAFILAGFLYLLLY